MMNKPKGGLKRRNNLDENGHGTNKKKRSSSTDISTYIGRDHELTVTEKSDNIGIIEKITLKNFMCHENLECILSPEINLLQGRNGSGKSAVLTAVVVALGGTSRSTNRAASLKDLVKYGKQGATVEVTIANQGEGSYKYHLYGPSIRVERKILAAGNAQYKIKDHRGNVVASKRDDLCRIRDAFNLQVENPITILNQDKARSFLTSEDPATLFKLFMEATRMQHVKEDYNILDGNVSSSKDIIEERRKLLPSLEKEIQFWKKKKDFLVNLDAKRDMEKGLRDELCWAYVREAEKEMLQLEAVHDNLKKNEKKALEKSNEYSKKIADGRNQLLQFEKAIESGTKEHDEEETNMKSFQDNLVQVRRSFKDERDKNSQMKEEKSKLSNEIRMLSKALNKDHDAERREWQLKNNERLQNIREIEDEIRSCENSAKTHEVHNSNLYKTLENLREQLQDITLEEKAYMSQFNDFSEKIRTLKNKESNKFSVFGVWLPKALQEIDVMFQRGMFERKPIGPLGAYIEVKEPVWAHIAEKALGGLLHSFRCHSWKDCQTLKSILSRHVKSMPNISVAKFQDTIYDVSRNETYSHEYNYRSLWSILEISDPVVANSIIDGAAVETILLIPNAQEAGSILKNRQTVPVNCNQAYTLKGDKYLPDPNFRIYSGEGERPARVLHTSVHDAIKDSEIGLKSLQSELQKIKEEKKLKQDEFHKLDNQFKRLNDTMHQAQNKIVALKGNLNNLRNTLSEEPLPADTHHLLEEMEGLKERLANLEEQMKEKLEEERKKKFLMEEAESKVKEAKRKVDKSREKLNEIKNELLVCQESTNQYLRKKETLIQKAKEEEKKANDQKKLMNKQLAKVDSTTADAQKIAPERVNSDRAVDKITNQLESLTKRLKMECDKLGSVEQVTSTYAEKFKLYQKTKNDITKQSSFLKKLQDGFANRMKTFEEICKYHAIYLNSYFGKALRHRNLQGSVDIDFTKKLLHININKDNGQKVGMSTPRKGRKNNNSLSMMSGGERSFVTVSFMLALWETIYSPLRMLDEFDVFMDMVSRNQSMDLMIQAAQPNIQYVYLTPLNVNRKNDKRISIFKMPDPVRDQN